jgi:hypothetical protein
VQRSWWRSGVSAVRLAARFVAATPAGRLVALAVALCAVMSFLELGVSYRTKAFAGAGLAVTATVVSELGFGLFMQAGAAWRAHRWRAAIRGLGALGGAIFTSGGLEALELSASARAAMVLAIAWVAIGPVLADVIVAYEAWGEATGADTERDELGAQAVRALLGAAALGGLAVYGLAQILPREWWLLLPVAAAAVWLCACVLAFAGRGPSALAADELARERELTPTV